MSSIYNWILNGKGRGKRYMLLLALIFSALTSFVVYFAWEDIIAAPNTKVFISKLPSIEIKNGVLIEPQSSYHDIIWTNSEKADNTNAYHLIINTNESEIDLSTTPINGIYLTPKNAYVLNNGDITTHSLEKLPDIKIKQNEWQTILGRGNMRFSLVLFFTLTIALFITFYLWSLIFALLSYFLTLFIPGENYSFPVRRRLSVTSLIIAYIIVIPLEFWGFYFGTFIFFFLVLLLMSFFLSGLPKTFIISIDRE